MDFEEFSEMFEKSHPKDEPIFMYKLIQDLLI